MKLVVLSDIHDGGAPLPGGPYSAIEPRRLLLRRAVRRINRFLRPDAVAVLGDLVEDGRAPDTAERYAALREIFEELTIPWLAIPGNHDAPPEEFYRHWPRPPETLEMCGARLLPFWDRPAPGYQAERAARDLARAAAAGAGWNGPVIALQHVPLFPPGTQDCPYNYVNAEAALAANARGGVTLTVAGHFHGGFAPLPAPGGWTMAAPALQDAPFRFLEILVETGAAPAVVEHALRMPDGLPLAESHVHTELAYCAGGITARAAVETCRLVGVGAPAFAEHSGQLYFDSDTFWSAAFMARGIRGRRGRVDRVAAYRAVAADAGVPPERVGFETDFDFQGRPVLRAADRARAGFLIGSYHWTPETAIRAPFDPKICAERHRRAWERMLVSGIDVLAHPFRIFNNAKAPPPAELFPELAQALARTGVAAELNYHVEEPFPEFVRACLEAGARFSLGTDSHGLVEVGDFWPHLQLLRRMGVADGDLDRVLWRPDGARRPRRR